MTMRDDPLSRRFGVILNERGERAEEILAKAVDRLRAEGYRLGGLYQVSTRLDNGRTRMELVDIDGGERHLISQNLGAQSRACCLDPEALVATSAVVRRAVAEGVDLLVINKFAGMEVEGEGLAPDAFEALTSGIPVLTCLSRRYQEQFETLTEGMGTYLPPRLSDILAWARTVIAATATEASA